MMNNFEKKFLMIEQLQKQKYPLLKGCIRDGILYPELYKKSPLKIMIVLKEPFDEWDKETQSPLGGGWSFEDIIRTLDEKYKEGLNKTWLKVAAMAYAIKNKVPYTEDLSLDQIKEGLSCICWINLSKTPWKTESDIKNPLYQERVIDWEPIVREQMSSIDFDIIFYGYTWDCSFINPIMPNEPWDPSKMRDVKMYCRKTSDGKKLMVQIFRYENSKKVIVNGYHPAFGISAEWQTEFIQDYLR